MNERYGNGAGALAIGGKAVTLDDRRIDQVEIALRARGAVTIDEPEAIMQQGFDMLAWIANGRR